MTKANRQNNDKTNEKIVKELIVVKLQDWNFQAILSRQKSGVVPGHWNQYTILWALEEGLLLCNLDGVADIDHMEAIG